MKIDMKPNSFLRITHYIFPIVLAALFFFSCASKNKNFSGVPDLNFSSASQQPRVPKVGDEVTVKVEVKNTGDAPSLPVWLFVKNDKNETIERRSVPPLYPEVSKHYSFRFPPAYSNYRVKFIVNPLLKMYETNRRNNILVYDIRLLTEQEAAENDRKHEIYYDTAMKRAVAEKCLPELKLQSLKRIDKIMDYELAESGDEVSLEAFLVNNCDSTMYDLKLKWLMKPEGDPTVAASMFGQVLFEKLNPGERKVLQRSFIAREGKWRIYLQLIPAHLSVKKDIRLKPEYFLIVH